jgi:glycerol-3-phosphate O-acyltransferase
LRVRGRYHRFGYASVSFGNPVSLRAFQAKHPSDTVTALGTDLMDEIGRVIPILPVSLVAAVLEREGSLPDGELRSRAFELKEEIVARGGHFHLPRDDFDYAVSAGLRLLKKRRILRESDGTWTIEEPARGLLTYYANSIRHLMQTPDEARQASI